jgi:hypothetical protein
LLPGQSFDLKDKSHSLPSFSAWLNKGFDLRGHARRMADARTDPEIFPASVFLALFHNQTRACKQGMQAL